MITNTDCTIYAYNEATQGYDRHYINAVMWQEQRTEKVLKTGIEISDGITIYIPKNTISIDLTGNKNIFVQGCCPFEFDNSSQKTISDSLKQFKIQYPDFVVAYEIASKFYARNQNLSHIKILAR